MNDHVHKPFADGRLKGLYRSLKNSPYPLHYSLRWPFYFRWPSTQRHGNKCILPQEKIIEIQPAVSQTKLLFGGDIMVLNGDTSPILCSQLLDLVAKADLFVANCEAPVGNHSCDSNSRYSFIFHMPRKFFEGIINQLPISPKKIILSNANNHSGDAGKKEFYQSLTLLKEMGITVLGENTPLTTVQKYNVNNISLGFCAWTHWQNCPIFDQEDKLLTFDHIKYSNFSDIKEKNSIDFMIGMPHWGYEFQHFPDKGTRKNASQLITNGFDFIMGSHPHLLQPFEYFNEKLCVYSLGNFCGLGVAWPVKIISILEVDLTQNAIGQVALQRYKVHFFYQQHLPDGVRISDFSELNNATRNRAIKRLKKLVLLNT